MCIEILILLNSQAPNEEDMSAWGLSEAHVKMPVINIDPPFASMIFSKHGHDFVKNAEGRNYSLTSDYTASACLVRASAHNIKLCAKSTCGKHIDLASHEQILDQPLSQFCETCRGRVQKYRQRWQDIRTGLQVHQPGLNVSKAELCMRLVPLKCIVGVVGFESAKSINPQNRESWHRLLGLPPGSSTPFAFAHRLTDRFLFTPSKMMSKCLPGQWVVTIPRLFLQEHKHLMSPDLADKVLRAIQRVAQKNAPYSL